MLGTATTVGVAWWCVWRAPAAGFDPYRSEPAGVPAAWPAPVPATWSASRWAIVSTSAGTGLEVVFATEPMADPWQAPIHVQHRVEAGWPWRALELHRSDQTAIGSGMLLYPATERRGWSGGVLMPGQDAPGTRGFQGHVFLPVLPMWPGFALNTLVFAAAWWPLLMILKRPLTLAVRWLRWRPGRCDQCRYELRGLPVHGDERVVCPECGAACRYGPVSDERRRRTRRRVRRMALCTVLGALTTVCVAWALTLRWSLNARRPDAAATARDWPDAAPPFGDMERVRFFRSFGVREVSGWDTYAEQERWAMRAGWPMRCEHMRCIAPIAYRWNIWDDPQAYWNGAVRLPAWVAERRTGDGVDLVPVRPLVAGFVGNTALYAVAWWGMMMAVQAAWRRRSGRPSRSDRGAA